MDRITQEFDFATYFLHRDHNITKVALPEGVTYKGNNWIELNPSYLRGRFLDDKGEVIKINPQLKILVQKVYEERIKVLFGEYSAKGDLIKKGYINFIESRENPTGIYKHILKEAATQGKFRFHTYTDSEGNEKQSLSGYEPKDPGKYNIVIIDHCRKITTERGYTLKQNLDKFFEYLVYLRNMLQWTFVPIMHTNRNITDVSTMKYLGEYLYPAGDSIKDSGNLSEDCNVLFTLLNPNDTQYNLTKHFGLKIKDSLGNELYPNLRTVHIAESRECSFPQHFRFNMVGNLKTFKNFTE